MPLGKQGLRTTEMPAEGKPILNTLGYYMHSGGHGVMPTDYPVFLDFIKKNFLEGK